MPCSPRRELKDQQRKGEVTRYCERATLLEKELGWWKTQVFGRTAQHHSSEVSVDQKMLFSETEVLGSMESAEYVFARRLFGDHLRPPVCLCSCALVVAVLFACTASVIVSYAAPRTVEALKQLLIRRSGPYRGRLLTDGLELYDSVAKPLQLPHYGCVSFPI